MIAKASRDVKSGSTRASGHGRFNSELGTDVTARASSSARYRGAFVATVVTTQHQQGNLNGQYIAIRPLHSSTSHDRPVLIVHVPGDVIDALWSTERKCCGFASPRLFVGDAWRCFFSAQKYRSPQKT